jgi:hypothetical protein
VEEIAARGSEGLHPGSTQFSRLASPVVIGRIVTQSLAFDGSIRIDRFASQTHDRALALARAH